MKAHNWKPLKKHGRRVARGAAASAPAYEVTPLGAANADLRAENKRLRAQLNALRRQRHAS